MSVWDERDLPQQPRANQSPRATGEFQAMGRVTGTAPVVKRPDGTTYLPAGSVYNDKYSTIQVLGEGGISIVYKARHAVMKNIVAIKLLNGTYPSNSATVLRFQREMQVISRLNHPCSVKVYEYGISREGQPFIVLDYLEGTSLAKLLTEYGPMPLSKALPVFIQVADALANAHGAGVNHLDLKPTNIFLTDSGSAEPGVKIFDYGLAECFDDIESDPDALTPSRIPWRSPFYMSPEQCQARDVDDRSDVYGLGCLMYKALTGMPVLRGENFAQTMQMQEQQMPVKFTQLAPENEDLALIEPVVFKCLQKSPGSRYMTMAQVSRALKEIQKGRTASNVIVTSAADDEEAEERRRAMLRNGLIALGVLAVFGSIGAVIYNWKSSTVDMHPIGPASTACAELDKGHYGEAKKQLGDLLSQARSTKSDDGINLCLSDQATLNHILADKMAETNDDLGLTELVAGRSAQLNAEGGDMRQIDNLLGGEQTGAELEEALAKPVGNIITQAQALAWGQKYAQARENMSPLPEKLSEKLGETSPLVTTVKVQYAMMLLQKIINPLAPLNIAQKQDLVSEPKALLEEPLNSGKDTDLLMAQSNFAVAEALSGNIEEAKKLRDLLKAAKSAVTVSGEKQAFIETRLADLAIVLDDQEGALPLYNSAYNRFVNAKNFPAAVYCAGVYCRTAQSSGHAKDCLDFLDRQLINASLNVPEAAILRGELAAYMAGLKQWMTTDKFATVEGASFPKPAGNLAREAESLALESLFVMQERRPADHWLTNPALSSLIKVYSTGNNIGRAVPLLRIKLAVAERTGNDRAAAEARNSLGTALLGYGKNAVAQAYAHIDGIQVTGDTTSPAAEAKALFKQSTAGSGSGDFDKRILWLDDSFVELATNFVENEADKAVLLVAADASCNKTADVYGKTSREYMNQLRGHGMLSWALKRIEDGKKNLVAAHDVAQANPGLPYADRRIVYSDLIAVCTAMKDTVGAKLYEGELQTLPRQ